MNISAQKLGESLARLRPEVVAEFLRVEGYQKTREEPRWGALFERGKSEVILPLDFDALDYGRMLVSIAECFTTRKRPLEDVVTSMVKGEVYPVRLRLAAAETLFGQIPAADLQELGRNLPAMIEAAAEKAIRGRDGSYHSGALLRQTTAGQTEFGSYVTKVYIPKYPAGVHLASTEASDAPGRLTALAILDNMRFLNSDKALSGEEAPPPSMSVRFAKAVSELPLLDHFGGQSAIEIAGRDLDEAQTGYTSIVQELDPLTRTRAEHFVRIVDQLRPEPEWFEGNIVVLRREPARLDREPEQRIAVRVTQGRIERLLHLGLSSPEYRRALEYHAADVRVSLRAMVVKTRGYWHVEKLLEFRPAEPKPGDRDLWGRPMK